MWMRQHAWSNTHMPSLIWINRSRLCLSLCLLFIWLVPHTCIVQNLCNFLCMYTICSQYSLHDRETTYNYKTLTHCNAIQIYMKYSGENIHFCSFDNSFSNQMYLQMCEWMFIFDGKTQTLRKCLKYPFWMKAWLWHRWTAHFIYWFIIK